MKARINRFPVIQVLSRRDTRTANLSTFTFFDGPSNREVSRELLDERGTAEWRRNLDDGRKVQQMTGIRTR